MIRNRIEKVQENLYPDCAFLVLNDTNRFYYTGFKSSSGAVLITKEHAYFLTDFRYIEKASSSIVDYTIMLSNNPDSEIKRICKSHGIKSLFIETYSTSISRLASLRLALSGIEIVTDDKFDRLTEEMRAIKSERELKFIKEAQRMTDETFFYIVERFEAGRTERNIMLDMEFYMRRLGSEGVSFDFIVVSGKNTSLPHGVPSDKKVEKGDFVTMDFGAVYNGYRSDMTRTVGVGMISDKQKEAYDTVLKAQRMAEEAVKPGAVCKDIDKIARDIINGAGYEGCFGHGLGHSVGIEIHENPCLNSRCDTILKPGMVLTNEPGIYIENEFGVRIEDMLYVTEDGCENLSRSKKSLIIV